MSSLFPSALHITIETTAGAVEVDGNFASIDAKTETGTIAVDVPDDDVKYQFLWTESHPRYLADFELTDVKEKAADVLRSKGITAETARKK